RHLVETEKIPQLDVAPRRFLGYNLRDCSHARPVLVAAAAQQIELEEHCVLGISNDTQLYTSRSRLADHRPQSGESEVPGRRDGRRRYRSGLRRDLRYSSRCARLLVMVSVAKKFAKPGIYSRHAPCVEEAPVAGVAGASPVLLEHRAQRFVQH